MPTFFTNYDRPPRSAQKQNKKEKVVETAGYVPLDRIIESYMNAGKRLQEARVEQFDFGPDDVLDETFSDVTRSSGFDMADATAMMQEALDGIREKANAAVIDEAGDKRSEKATADQKEDGSIEEGL